MKKLFIALIGAAVSSTSFAQVFPPLDPGGGYQITTTATGKTVSDGYSGPIAPTAMWCRGTGGKTAKAFIEIEVEVTYTGIGTPSDNQFIRITPLTYVSASGGIWTLESTDGTESKEVITSGPGSESRARQGATLRKITLGSDGKMKLKLKASAIALNETTGVMGAKAGFAIELVDRGAEILPSTPSTTYRRAPYGVAIKNVPDEENIAGRVDTGMLFNLETTFNIYKVSIYSDYDLLGAAVGAWENPVTLATSPVPAYQELVPGGLLIQHRLALGSTSQSSYNERQAWIGQQLAPYVKKNPLLKVQELFVSDFRGSDATRIPVYIHGPLEDTGEEWHDEYGGRLDLCQALMQKTDNKFMPVLLGAHGNYTASGGTNGETIEANVTIERSFEVTSGVELNNTIGLEFGIESLKATWGQDVKVSSTTAFTKSEKYSMGVNLRPGREFRLWYGAVGTARFATVAKYGPAGFEMDLPGVDVRGLVGKHMSQVVNIGAPLTIPDEGA